MIAHTSVAQHAMLAALCVLAVAGYAVLWTRLRRASVVEPVIWATGIAIVLLATAPPLEHAADRSFTWHMAQHLDDASESALRVEGQGLLASRAEEEIVR